MKIKKHKIEVLSGGQQSGFVVDLRSKDNDFKKKYYHEINDSKKNNESESNDHKRDSKSNINNNFNESDKNIGVSSARVVNNKKSFLKSYNFLKNKYKFNFKLPSTKIEIPPTLINFKKTFLFPFFLFIFKILRAIIYFFIDWIVDIYKFFKKNIKFSKFIFKIKKKLKINFYSKKKVEEIKDKIKQGVNNTNIGVKKLNKTPVLNFSINTKNFNFRSKKKSIWFFVLILFILIVPFKIFSYYKLISDNEIRNDLLQYSSSGLENFLSASQNITNLDLSSSQQEFFQAGNNFLKLDQELKKIDEFIIFLSSFSGDEKIKLASESKKIAKLGIHLSLAGDNFSLAVNSLILAFSDSNLDMDKNFSDFYYYSKKAESEFKKANNYLKKIKISSIPKDYQEQFKDIKNKADVLEKNFSSFLKIVPGLKDFLGVNADRRYLIVFQNNYESRATGGFIGSYALVDLKKGRIKKIEIPPGGSYDTEGGMKVLMESPKPLHLIKPIWYFWDANWWPDWKMSAQNLMWFYEKSGGSSVDGVISLTPDVLSDILKIIGPIDLSEKYGVIVDSDNFWETIQEIVEVTGQPELYQNKNLKTDILGRIIEENKATSSISDNNIELEDVEKKDVEDEKIFLRNEPKKIIGDLMSKILERFSNNFNKEILVKTLQILEKNLSNKNVLLYFNNPEMQNEVEKRSWAGRVKDTPLDYLMIVYSNVAGGKTDKFIGNNFSLNTKIEADGSIINKLIIKRNHNGEKDSLFSGIRNVSWLRVYVPLGSSLISAKGFSYLDERFFKDSEDFYEKNDILELSENRAEVDLRSGTKIYQESNKTVFANWDIIDPGQENIIEIEYRLPQNFYSLFPIEEKSYFFNLYKIKEERIKNYSLLWQKQSGFNNAKLEFNFKTDLDIKPFWYYPEKMINEDSIKLFDELENDKYLVIMLK